MTPSMTSRDYDVILVTSQ